MYKYPTLKQVNVEQMPETLEQGILYHSAKYGTAIHLCACGCGGKTVTALYPFWKDHSWNLAHGENGPTLLPSIGNMKMCGSHYWVRDGHIVQA